MADFTPSPPQSTSSRSVASLIPWAEPGQLSAEDQVRLERLLERTMGHGFKLVILEVATPRDRQAVLARLREPLANRQANVRELDVAAWNRERQPGLNFWGELIQAVPPATVTSRDCLVFWGFEEIMYVGSPDGADLLRQINAQRDLLVRDYGCFWILFVHPRSRQAWKRYAPDFCDFVSLWTEASPLAESSPPRLELTTHVDLPIWSSHASRTWPPELREAERLLHLSHYDEGLDKLQVFRARRASDAMCGRDLAVVRMLEAYVLHMRGELVGAAQILVSEVIPALEQAGDESSRADAWGYLADIVTARGEFDEAIRIRRYEELPIYERLADHRSRAVTLGKIADVLAIRGNLDDALRIFQEEELPVYERLGDIRERAVTLAKIADILALRGDVHQAMSIWWNDALPVFEQAHDLRSRAVTLGKIADVLMLQGELEQSLRIRLEEELPLFERLGDVRNWAVARGKVADILAARGELNEALRIRHDEELPIYERVGDPRERALVLGKIGHMLAERGELNRAIQILTDEVLTAYDRLGAIRDRLMCQWQIALYLLERDQPGDRTEAAKLLDAARTAAERLRIPEATEIQKTQQLIAPLMEKPLTLTPRRNGSTVNASRPQSQSWVGRNDPCPCGSGKKFKKCCGRHQVRQV